MKVLAALLALLMLGGARASEFSVRCDGKPPAGSYFATFDTDSGAVVFETASPNATSSDGINVLAGELSKTSLGKDGRIDFAIRAPDGNVSLTYDIKGNRMVWPGIISGDPIRPTLTHVCATIAPRSILSFRTTVPILHPISIRCAEAGYMYFTMDSESRKVLFERDGGPIYSGEIVAIRGDDVDLVLKDGSQGHTTWSKSLHTVTFESASGKRSTPKQCEEIAPRTMIEYYKRLK